MANGQVEIHDPFSNHNGLTDSIADCDHKPTSDSDSMEDTLEFRLLMAYAKRRRPRKESRPKKESPPQDSLITGGTDVNGSASQPETKTITEKKKKRKGWRRLPSILRCISSKTTDGEEPRSQITAEQPDVHDRCADVRREY